MDEDKKTKESTNDFQTRKGKEISEHLASVNMEPWYYIYENYINPKQKSNKNKE